MLNETASLVEILGGGANRSNPGVSLFVFPFSVSSVENGISEGATRTSLVSYAKPSSSCTELFGGS